MKVFVTGGAGFIGSHVCVELLNASYEVVIADNFSNSKPETVENIQKITGKPVSFYRIDLCEPEGVRRIFAEHSIDAVIHFAGLKSVPESVQKPLEYYENNLGGTFALCRAMGEAGCKRIVFSSSATVYGMDNPVPFREGMPTSATNPYGYTKVMAEQILTDLSGCWERTPMESPAICFPMCPRSRRGCARRCWCTETTITRRTEPVCATISM